MSTDRKNIVEGVVNYFRYSDQWHDTMKLIEEPSEETYHVHLYMWSSVAADSLRRITERYFEKRKIPLDRKIDLVASQLGLVCLHNVHPSGSPFRPAIDMWWRHKKDAILEPMDPPEGEDRKNFLPWGKSFMDAWMAQFHFRTVGPKEEGDIRRWFRSAHWNKALRLVEDPRYSHVHVNVELNFDPWILRMCAEEELRKVGWRIDHVYPCVYHIPRGYQGKIVFLTGHPEEVWDICWQYNPDVTIRPALIKFAGSLPDDDISFDAWSTTLVEGTLAANPYVSLTPEEIETVVAAL